jgi:hypothetical protein
MSPYLQAGLVGGLTEASGVRRLFIATTASKIIPFAGADHE